MAGRKEEMEEQTLAELLYDSAFFVKKQGRGCSEEQKIWASFLKQLNQDLDASGCGAKAEAYTESGPYQQACGFHRDYGYFMVSCGDRGSKSITILEEEEETAKNRFLALIIDRQAYKWVLGIKGCEEASWPYHCQYDYRRLWFGKALEWLAPAVDWAFFAQCAERYIGLLNRWFARPHWEYDCQIGRIIEISDSREHSDSQYLYRIEPAEEPGGSRIRLERQYLTDRDSGDAFAFDIDGEALDMRRLEEGVLILMDREEDNIDAYSLDGRFLWNIGEKLSVHRRYHDLYEDICGIEGEN